MTISFPRDFPLSGVFTGECEFDLVPQQTQSLTGGASPDVADVAPSLWMSSYQTTVLNRADFATWGAWFASLRGGLRLFKATVPHHRWPLAYPRGFAGLLVSGVQFTGSGNLSAIGAGRDTVTIDQLPIGLVLSVGDWFSIPAGSRQLLHRIIEGGTADGSGAVSVTCEPVIRVGISTGIAVLLDGPYCDMNLPEKPNVVRYATRGGSISFKGRQVAL